MQKRFAVEIVCVMLVLFVIKGQSLRCYRCRSDVDKGCEDENLNKSLAVDCPHLRQNETGGTLLCRKINQKLKFKHEEDFTIIRECGYEKGPDECYNFKWVNLGYQVICECAEEECNGENRLIPNFMVVAVLFFLLGLFNYLNCDNT